MAGLNRSSEEGNSYWISVPTTIISVKERQFRAVLKSSGPEFEAILAL